MHDAETKALVRAVLLLLAISILRWGWSMRSTAPLPPGESVLPELMAESREAAAPSERRGEPLADGETVDPNRDDEVTLDRLPGVGPATARAIIDAREGGASFRRPDDLLAVSGIGPATLSRMHPFLDFDDPPPRRPGTTLSGGVERIDVNRASAARLEALPGIGPAIASRIVAERQKQLFSSVEDLERVRGIGPATVERLRALVILGPGR